MMCRVALAQCAPRLGDPAENLRRHLEWTGRAISEGADLIVFPELSLTGYTLRDLTVDVAMTRDDPRLDALRAVSHRITIIAGGIEEGNGGELYNAAFLFEDGHVRTQRKIYPPDYGLFEEQRYVLPGNNLRAMDTRCGRLGVLICEDAWHVSLPLLLALDGAQAIVILSASPTRLSGTAERNIDQVNAENHRVIARLLSVHVISVNRTGFEDGVQFCGGSDLVSPVGETLFRAGRADEELLFGTVDRRLVKRARLQSQHFLDERPEFLLAHLREVIGAR